MLSSGLPAPGGLPELPGGKFRGAPPEGPGAAAAWREPVRPLRQAREKHDERIDRAALAGRLDDEEDDALEHQRRDHPQERGRPPGASGEGGGQGEHREDPEADDAGVRPSRDRG
jgi:hypothetical protein